MKLVRALLWSAAVLALVACGTPAQSSKPQATAATPSPTSTALVAAPSGSSTAERCNGRHAVSYHQAPELEAMLPAHVAGRDLAIWSVRGRCWLELYIDDDATVEKFLTVDGDPSAIDPSHLAQAIAGRSDTGSDPPYFVFAAARPLSQDEIDLTLLLLLGGIGFTDVDAGANLDNYAVSTIGGKEVYVGTSDMVNQSDHQRGIPYLYQTENELFIVITDDEAWAREAIEQLP